MSETIELEIRMSAEEEATVRLAAHTLGITVDQFVNDALLWALARPRSRNVREGCFVGCYAGKAVRRRKPVPPLYLGGIELFPECPPYVDANIAWMTLSERLGVHLPVRRPRYIAKACR